MKAKNLHCGLKLSAALLVISIDSKILARIYTDLIRNAEREMDSGGVLDIRTYESDNNYHIEFKNTCLKTNEKDLEPFFLPFNGDQESGLAI